MSDNMSLLGAGGGGVSINVNGLILYFKVDETSGTVAIDSSPSGNNGTYHGTASSTDVAAAIKSFSKASRSFNGTTDYASFGAIGAQAAFSIMCWVKDTGANANEAGYFGIIGSTPDVFDGWGLYRDSADTGKPSWSITGNSATGRLKATSSSNDGNWHHLAGTYDGVTAIIYFDGVSQNSAAKTAGPFGANTGFFGSSAATTDNLSGKLDDMRMYNRALSPTEIASIAAGTA